VKRFNSTLSGLVIVGCTVLIYAALVVLSAGCALAHADRTQAHHHHSEKSSSPQNAFCAWACQATSDIASVAEPAMAVAWLVTEPQVLPAADYPVSSVSIVLHPRAPPVTALLSRG
jgi:threonine/homoserine/homoserine lactone efflux protein